MEFLLAGLVLFFVLLSEFLRRKEWTNPVFARKILHIGAISASAPAVYYFNTIELLFVIGAAIPILAAAVFFGFFRNEENGRKSYGILYFALSFFALTLLFGERRPELVFYPMMVLAWADGLATVIGYAFGKRKFDFSPEGKTVEGGLAFLTVAAVVLAFCHSLVPGSIPEIEVEFVFFMAVFLAVLESLSVRSFDNLWVPAATAYWLLISPSGYILLFAILIPALAFFAFRRKWLTSGGAFAAAILGWIFLISPHPEVVVFPTVFFLIGSLLSKLPRAENEGSVRNANQVFANGGIPAIFFMAYFVGGDFVFLIAAISGFAFATSDTAASEIGVRMGGKHFKLLNGKETKAGVSGAVTVRGSLAGLGFALVVAAIALLPLFDFGFREALIIAAAGVFGNIADSLIGDLFQAKYADPDGTVREYAHQSGEKPIRGFSWVTNSTTNFLASLIACLFGLLLAGLF